MSNLIETYYTEDQNRLIEEYHGINGYLIDSIAATLKQHDDGTYQWVDNTLHDYSRTLGFYKSIDDAEKALADYHYAEEPTDAK